MHLYLVSSAFMFQSPSPGGVGHGMEKKFDKTFEILFELKVSDAMKRDAITIGPGDTMEALNRELSAHRLSGLPVVEGNSLVGIISISDLIVWLSEGGKEARIRERMVKDPQCLYQDQPLLHAINRFEQLGYGRFPVLDREKGNLVGIITKSDIIECTLRRLEHDYSEEEVRHYRASHFFEDISADFFELSLSFKVAGGDFDRAGTASTTMKRNLKRLGVPPDIVRRAAIAAYEAEMNLVIFADGGTMQFSITGDRIRIEVRDEGPGIEDVEMAMVEGYSTAEPWVRELGFGAGMGLPNMKKCTDTMEITSSPGKGTSIVMDILTGEGREKNHPHW